MYNTPSDFSIGGVVWQTFFMILMRFLEFHAKKYAINSATAGTILQQNGSNKVKNVKNKKAKNVKT